jgi:hypothetical protein
MNQLLELISSLLLVSLTAPADDKPPSQSNGLAPVLPGLNLKDKLNQLEARLPDLEKPFISTAPEDKQDGLLVGRLGVDGGNLAAIEAYANELTAPPRMRKRATWTAC